MQEYFYLKKKFKDMKNVFYGYNYDKINKIWELFL